MFKSVEISVAIPMLQGRNLTGATLSLASFILRKGKAIIL